MVRWEQDRARDEGIQRQREEDRNPFVRFTDDRVREIAAREATALRDLAAEMPVLRKDRRLDVVLSFNARRNEAVAINSELARRRLPTISLPEAFPVPRRSTFPRIPRHERVAHRPPVHDPMTEKLLRDGMTMTHEAVTCRDIRCEPHHATEMLLDRCDRLHEQMARLAETYGSLGPVREMKAARRAIEVTHRQLVEVTDALRDRGLPVEAPSTVDQIKQEANARFARPKPDTPRGTTRHSTTGKDRTSMARRSPQRRSAARKPARPKPLPRRRANVPRTSATSAPPRASSRR